MFISKKEKATIFNRIEKLEQLVIEHECTLKDFLELVIAKKIKELEIYQNQLPDKLGNLTLYVEKCENKIKSLNDRLQNFEKKLKKQKKND